jgi:ketosteroid isomerase-like protein
LYSSHRRRSPVSAKRRSNEWTSRATARGGAAYHNRNVGIFTVRDGKIAAVREYTDT